MRAEASLALMRNGRAAIRPGGLALVRRHGHVERLEVEHLVERPDQLVEVHEGAIARA